MICVCFMQKLRNNLKWALSMGDFAKGVCFCVSDIVRIGDKKAVYQVEILSDLIITITGGCECGRIAAVLQVMLVSS